MTDNVTGAPAHIANRQAEYEAFDRLPRRIRDAMNDMPLPYSAIQVGALLARTPPGVIESVLKKAARDHLRQYRRVLVDV